MRVQATGADARIAELDGLRGCAVLMVLSWHFIGATLDRSLGAWAAPLARVLVLGRSGVDLFFVLSGFLITGIVLARRRDGAAFLGSFYARRALRILPPYLLLVGVFWALVAAGVSSSAINGQTPLWRHLSFTQNFWMIEHGVWGPGAISVTWSVAIEEHYYLVFPLLMLLLARRWVPAFLVTVALLSWAHRVGALDGTSRGAFAGYIGTLSRLDGLALGGLVAWAWQDDAARRWLETHKRAIGVAAVAMFVAGALLGIGFAARSFFLPVDLAWHMMHWGHAFLAVLCATIVASVVTHVGDPRLAWLRGDGLRFVGGVSYTVYLFHPLILSVVFLAAHRAERVMGWADAGLVVVATVLTFAFATACRRWIEAPAIAYGRRYAY